MNFRVTTTPLHGAPEFRPVYSRYPPTDDHAVLIEKAKRNLRATINGFYRCAAVSAITIKQRGERRRVWEVRLDPGNDRSWIEPHLGQLVAEFHRTGFPDLERIAVR